MMRISVTDDLCQRAISMQKATFIIRGIVRI